MTTFSAITSGQIDAESPYDTTLAAQHSNNYLAVIEGDASASAHKIQAAALDSGIIDQNAIGAGAVGQSEIKTTTGVVSTTSLTYANIVLPGGLYGLYPQVNQNTSGKTMSAKIAENFTYDPAYSTRISLLTSSGGTAFARQPYIQASPPYDLGDGAIPMFIFLDVDSLGNVRSLYAAPEAPWHYNGFTDIRANRKDKVSGRSWKEVPQIIAELNDANLTKQEAVRLGLYSKIEIADRIANDEQVEIEITQAIKQADMPIVPHPFIGHDLRSSTIVILDPVSPTTEKLLTLHDDGENINELIHEGKVTFGNTPLVRSVPFGVMAVDLTL